MVGVGLFLSIVLLIGVSAFLRPAGEHITAEPTEESIAADEAALIAAEPVAPVAAAPVVADPLEDGIGAGETAGDTVAAATVTPGPSTGDAIVATGASSATADGTVNQAAVAATDLVGPSDQVEGTVNPPVAAE